MIKPVFLVVGGLMPGGNVFGIYETSRKANEAIEKNDPSDSWLCHIIEFEMNQWSFPPIDV